MGYGHLYVISAPSGTGKTTVIRELRSVLPALAHSVSYTTRAARPNEVDGTDYFFVDEATFQQMVADEAFIEWVHVHDHSYGTPKKQIEKLRQAGRNVMLDIEIQGAANVRTYDATATLIFLAPPSLDVLAARLRGRGTETPASMALRLKRASKELAAQSQYDHVVVNDGVSEACAAIVQIIQQRHDSVAQ
jgi:guanylate kinase